MPDTLICPPQSAPISEPDSELLNKNLWLYLHDMGKRVNAITSAAPVIPDLRLSMSDFGAVPDGIQGVSGSITAGTNLLTIAATDPPLTTDMAGKPIAIFGAGGATFSDTGHERCAGAHLVTTIASVGAGGLSCRTVLSASNTVTGTQWCAGTDNRPAFSAAIAVLRENNGGDLWFDQAGIYLFASFGHTNLFGWYFADLIDFDGCHIHQGEKAKIVCGFPMQFLSINDIVFYQWAKVANRPPIARITAPVTEGTILIQCNPTDIVAGRYNRDDWVLIFTGYVLDQWVGFEVPDAQICQIVFADTVSGIVILSEPTLKPFVAENYPAPVGWTGPVGAAPFGLINVTDILIHDFRYENLTLDSFFSTFQVYGGQVDGCYLDGVRVNLRGGFHAMNYIHNGETNDVRAYIDNLSSPNLPFDYAWTVAVGSSHVKLSKAQIDSTGVTYLHLHEGAANCSVDLLRLGTFSGSPQSISKTLIGGAITIGTTTLAVTAGFVAGDVGKTLQVNGTYTAVIKAFINATHVTVFPPAPATFAAATVVVGFDINAVHIAGRSYGLKVSNSIFIGYDINAVLHISADCTAGGLITNCAIAGRGNSTLLKDVECFGTGWRIDIPSIAASRLYQYSSNLGRPLLRGTQGNLTALEGSRGLSAALGGVGRVGNIEEYSNDLTGAGFWNAGAGVTRTANTGDIPDPIGTHTATKIVTGATSANMEVSKDHLTPAPGSVVGAGNNGDRSFVFSFYVYSPIENEMECFIGSFLAGVDPTNTTRQRVAVYPQWQRIDLVVNFNSAAAAANEIVTGVASAFAAPVVGLNSTFYIWGCTLQEVSQLWPLITVTTGTKVEYQDPLYSQTGKLLLAATIALTGSGSPETVVTAPIGSLYLRTNGGAGTVLYLKESGTGNTGWIAYNGAGSTLPVVDTTALVKGSGDATKLVRIEADGLTTATTRVAMMPDRDITLNQINNLSADCTTLLTCPNTTAYADVVGGTVTLTETGKYLIIGTFDVGVDVSANQVLGQLVVNGVAQAGVVSVLISTGTGTDSVRLSAGRPWSYINSGSNVAKLQAKKINAGGTGQVNTPGTNITAIFLG